MDALDQKIVTYLLMSSKKTTPQIAKALNQAPAKIEYHVQKLAEKEVLLVEMPPHRNTIRRYGKKYYINPKLRSNSKNIFLLATVTIALTMVGVMTLLLNPVYSGVMLIMPSIIGAIYAIQKLRQIYHAEIREIENSLSR